MQDIPFVHNQQPQDTLSFTTDTATPQTIIPIFYFHTNLSSHVHENCQCTQNNDAQLLTLLRALTKGELELGQVVDSTVE